MHRFKDILKKIINFLKAPAGEVLIKRCVVNKMYYEGSISLKTKIDRLKDSENDDCY